MGVTQVTVSIRPAEPRRTWEALCVVDTGATDLPLSTPVSEGHRLPAQGAALMRADQPSSDHA